MAAIDTSHLSAIVEENTRLIDTAKGLWDLTSQISDPKASGQLQEQVKRLLDISERISGALANAK